MIDSVNGDVDAGRQYRLKRKMYGQFGGYSRVANHFLPQGNLEGRE